MDRVRIGFVGAGRMGQCAHLKNYAVLDECSVVALAEPQKELRSRVAEKYGIPKVYENYNEMIDSEKLDGIVASQPFGFHWQIVPELLKAGIPLFIEKPLACSPEYGEKILEALNNSGTWLMVGYNKRSDHAVIYAKKQLEKWLKTGEMGQLRYVRISVNGDGWVAGGFDDFIMTGEKPPPRDQEPMPSDMDEDTFTGYRNFVNFYIHQVNLLRHLFGEGYTVNFADRQNLLLAAESSSGKTGIIEMNPYSASGLWHESVFVAMEKGYIEVKLPPPMACNVSGRVSVFTDARKDVPPEFLVHEMPPVHSMRMQAVNFIRSIKGVEKPSCEAGEALEDLKTAREYFRIKKG